MQRFRYVLFICIAVLVFSAKSNAADPENVMQYCEKSVNRSNSYDCACITKKYYPKKAELEQLYDIAITEKEAVMVHITNQCVVVENTGSREYGVCITSGAFKRNRNAYGAERFCQCYSDEWEKQLSNYLTTTPNANIDSKSGSHLKIIARTTCEKQLQ